MMQEGNPKIWAGALKSSGLSNTELKHTYNFALGRQQRAQEVLNRNPENKVLQDEVNRYAAMAEHCKTYLDF
jgi:hypothetical protein